MAGVPQMIMKRLSLHFRIIKFYDISEGHTTAIFRVTDLGFSGCCSEWEGEKCQLCRSVARTLAIQSYEERKEDKSCTDPVKIASPK